MKFYRSPAVKPMGSLALTLTLLSLSGCSLFGTPAKEKILGRWQAEQAAAPNAGKQTLVFQPDGKLFILAEEVQPPVALQMGYKLNSDTKPMQIDIIVNDKVKLQTILEFTKDDKLKLQLDGLTPQAPRPANFSDKAQLYAKISLSSALPENTQIETPETQQKKAQAAEGLQSVGALLQAQQVYQQKNKKFAKDIKELGFNTVPETQNYKLQIASDSDRSAAVIAQAKTPELFSYTGVLFVLKDKDKDAVVGQICVTEQPSTLPPALPKAPKDKSTPVQCPAGSKPLVNQAGK